MANIVKEVEQVEHVRAEISRLLDAWKLRSRPQIQSVKPKFDPIMRAIIAEMEMHDELCVRPLVVPLSSVELDELTAHAGRLQSMLSDLKAIPLPVLPRAACN